MSLFINTETKMIDAVKQFGVSGEMTPETNRFVAAYWKPVFRYLRMRGWKNEAAEDLTQSFFLQLLEKGWVNRAEEETGSGLICGCILGH